MSEMMGDLIKIIKFMEKQQNIMVKMLIHFGFRADLQDDFIRGCLKELENLEFITNSKDIDK